MDGDTIRLVGDVASEADLEAALAAVEGLDVMGGKVVENAMVVAAADDDESPAEEDAVDDDPSYNG